MNFAEFIAPKTVESFLSEDYGRRPVHIRGESPRAGLLSMARLEQLLSVRPHWTEANLKLILNSRPVLGEHYMDRTASGLTCADPAKVQLFLRMGASLVGDHIEDIDPAVRQAANMLSDQFAGTAGANVYCSFKNIRAFNSHCDLHEVFAVQLEGEKVWQIYENRADAPVEALEGKDAQAIIDQAKGRVMMTVRMQPGDLLYIPRGYFHDALADSDASLHLTFGVKPLDGRIVFRLLEDLAVQNSGFRAYLPDGRTDAAGLREHLEHISEKLTGILRSPEFEDRLRNRQRAVVSREHRVDMKDVRKLDYYAHIGMPVEVTAGMLRHGEGEEALGQLAEAAEWAIGQAAFSQQQLQAQFPWLSEAEVRSLIQLLVRVGAITPYEPGL